MNFYRTIVTSISAICFTSLLMTSSAHAASKVELDAKSYASVQVLKEEVPGAEALIEKAYAMLIFPEVLGAGFWLGGEYGEGKMYVDDYTYGYYNLVSASFGFQMGAQVKSEAISFMT